MQLKGVVFLGSAGQKRRGPLAVPLAHWWGRQPAAVRWHAEHCEGCLWWRLLWQPSVVGRKRHMKGDGTTFCRGSGEYVMCMMCASGIATLQEMEGA